MLIVNADDFGRNRLATDRILECHKRGTVTSASAMVFMEDSERAAELALAAGLDVGLHLNFSQPFVSSPPSAVAAQAKIIRVLTRSKYSPIFYYPALRRDFLSTFQMQQQEFVRLYHKPPSHYDGHHHMHLCSNMLLQSIIPPGQKVRRTFSPRGYSAKQMYRALVDKCLSRNYRLTDFLFSLLACLRSSSLSNAIQLAGKANVELETHPELDQEFHWLSSNSSREAFSRVPLGTYTGL